MSRLQPVNHATTTGKGKELPDAVKSKLGIVPNMTRVMAISPAVLEAYLTFNGALAGGVLDAKTSGELALVYRPGTGTKEGANRGRPLEHA